MKMELIHSTQVGCYMCVDAGSHTNVLLYCQANWHQSAFKCSNTWVSRPNKPQTKYHYNSSFYLVERSAFSVCESMKTWYNKFMNTWQTLFKCSIIWMVHWSSLLWSLLFFLPWAAGQVPQHIASRTMKVNDSPVFIHLTEHVFVSPQWEWKYSPWLICCKKPKAVHVHWLPHSLPVRLSKHLLGILPLINLFIESRN